MPSPRAWLKRQVLEAVAARNDVRRRQLNQVGGIPPAAWGAAVRDGVLSIGNCDVTELAREFGTPLHVVSERKLRDDFCAFLGAFRAVYPKVELGYSYKTNPLPGVIRILHQCGALAEVISHYELWLALELGVAPANIIFNGPAKTAASIDLAVGRGIKLINIDGLDEVDLVGAAATRHGVEQAVGVRVVTSVGWQAQFGLRISTGEAREAFERIRAHPRLKPIGLHVHLGTGIKDVPVYVRAIREMLEFARALEAETGIRLSYFDFGGGFGVPTVRPFDAWDERLSLNRFPVGPVDVDKAPRPTAYAAAIGKVMREFYPESDLPTIAFEPGRALSSGAQSLILRVLAVKRGRDGVTRVILDGGKNLALPTGYEYHEILPASRMNAKCVQNVSFFGPLCHPGDVLFVEKPFPPVEVGDLVAVMDAGAYFIPNQMNFSNPRPSVVVVSNGLAHLLRRRESYEDMVRLDHFTSPPNEGLGLEQLADVCQAASGAKRS